MGIITCIVNMIFYLNAHKITIGLPHNIAVEEKIILVNIILLQNRPRL